MSNTEIDVSIIIVNYNTKDLTRQCIKSIFEKTKGISFEVIIVDNNSSDDSQKIIIEEFPQIIFIKNSHNIGFGRANNVGAKRAKGNYLFFLNSDTILLNNAIYILYIYINTNKKAGICGGNLFDNSLKPIHSYSMYLPSISWEINKMLKFIPEKIRYGRNRGFNHTNYPIEVGYITGADMLIRRDLFNLLKGFDEDFFMYFEETELTFRVKKIGYKVFNIPQAKIIHLCGKSNNKKKSKAYMRDTSRKLYYRKTHNQHYYQICNIISYINNKI